jgi:hypothetical protein
MPIPCILKPRADATADELKQLGTVFAHWSSRELTNEGVLYSIDQKGLDSLLAGELPDPLALQAWSHHEGIPPERIRQDLGPLASERSVRFNVKDEPHCTRGMAVQSLRQAIPADLVEDIFIGDASWTE